MENLIVRLSDKKDYSNTFDLEFDLVQSDFLPKWIDRFLHAQQRQDVISDLGQCITSMIYGQPNTH